MTRIQEEYKDRKTDEEAEKECQEVDAWEETQNHATKVLAEDEEPVEGEDLEERSDVRIIFSKDGCAACEQLSLRGMTHTCQEFSIETPDGLAEAAFFNMFKGGNLVTPSLYIGSDDGIGGQRYFGEEVKEKLETESAEKKCTEKE